MEGAIRSPDDIAPNLQGQRGDDISCYVFESLAVECFRAWILGESQLRQRLGFEAWFEVHAVLKESGERPDDTLSPVSHETLTISCRLLQIRSTN
jgi:hypothetical protein